MIVAPLLLAILPGAPPQEVVQDPPVDLIEALERAVDQPTPQLRARAARELAERPEPDLAGWLALTRSFGRFEPQRAGSSRHRAELTVLGKAEETEIHVYLPPGYTPTSPAPLMVAFHGTGGSGAGLPEFWRTAADALGMVVVAPSETGENVGYGFTPREREAALAALRWTRRHYHIDEDRIFLSGISRGGHLAWDLALRFPDRFAAIAPMVGGPRLHTQQGQNNLRYTENLLWVGIRDLQGVHDDPGLVFNLRLAFERLARQGARDAELLLQEDHGHSFDPGAVPWPTWLGGCARPVLPSRIVRTTATPDEGRAYWAEILGTSSEVQRDFRPKVDAKQWNALDDEGKKRFLQDQADERTARLEIARVAPGSFEAQARHVTKFRLLLAEGLYDPAEPVRVRYRNHTVTKRAQPSKRLLLEEFVERFDRRFLPVSEVVVGR